MSGLALMAFASMAALLVVPPQSGGLAQRPVALPAVHHGEACPVSTGTRGQVPRQQHIFGTGLWFGRGPVYLGLAWKAGGDDIATFNVVPVPVVDGMRRAKTPWISVPDYAGPIVVRGHALNDPGKALLFTDDGRRPATQLSLQAPRSPSRELWSFWPTSMFIPGPGCYGLQIDTAVATDVVVFEAT